MTKCPIIAAALIYLLAVSAAAAEKPAAKPALFEFVTARFEQNATDGDVEAVFETLASDDGLVKLTVVAPDGRTIIDFAAPGRAAMGIREFRFESPEPTDTAALKKAYPEGAYTFTGSTSRGAHFEDKTTLSHKLPPATSFVSPEADAHNVATKNLRITWAPVKGVSGYTIELEPSRTSAHIEMQLPASVTSFVVPDGVLRPGGKCQLGIGTVSSDGNVSVIETTFTTAAN
jgi:hypothetical protein